jgi:hypothetical protein
MFYFGKHIGYLIFLFITSAELLSDFPETKECTKYTMVVWWAIYTSFSSNLLLETLLNSTYFDFLPKKTTNTIPALRCTSITFSISSVLMNVSFGVKSHETERDLSLWEKRGSLFSKEDDVFQSSCKSHTPYLGKVQVAHTYSLKKNWTSILVARKDKLDIIAARYNESIWHKYTHKHKEDSKHYWGIWGRSK